MTQEQQRIAIAEACGWEYLMTDAVTGTPYGVIPAGSAGDGPLKALPDYLHDLNAMHEAEKVLTKIQGWKYETNIDMVVRPGNFTRGSAWIFGMITATAPQRAEAFLKTIGKWQE